MKELLKKKSTKAALLLIVVAVIAVIVGMNVQSTQKKNEYNAHIEAAEKYLTELDYEQAIAEYTLALEIEPNAEEVLNGLEKTYLAYADSLADAGEYEKAIQILNEGYAQIGRESLQEKIVQIQEMQTQIEEEERLEAERAEILKPYMQQVYNLMAAEDYEQIRKAMAEMAQIEEFESVLAAGPYLYFPQESDSQTGVGVGLYPLHDWHVWYNYEEIVGPLDISCQYAVYYGDFVAGKREGNGVSVIYRPLAVFQGEWKSDAPNGYGEVVRDAYVDQNIQMRTSGNLVDGLWDGTVNLQNYGYSDENGASHIWDSTIQITNGIPEDKTEAFLVELENYYGLLADGHREQFNSCFAYDYHFMEEVVYYNIGKGQTIGIWEFANVAW